MKASIAALLILLTMFFTRPSFAVSDVYEFGKPDTLSHLTLYSTVDIKTLSPLITHFISLNPEVGIKYEQMSAVDLYDRVIREKDQPKAGLVISSAMDLQLKLVNDGFAQRYQSVTTDELPAMATWRNQVFAFSLEPIVMVANRGLFPNSEFPNNRQELLQAIRQYSNDIKGRIGTYDVRKSGVGYLLASQDSRQANTTWGRLLEAFGSHKVRTYCCSNEIIDDIESGRIVLGYNLLGSYAYQRVLKNPWLIMIIPSDYTLMLMRVALIPKNTADARNGELFLDYLLSDIGQKMMQSENLLYPIKASSGQYAQSLSPSHPTRVIELDQQLLLGRDYAKQKRFIEEWEYALELNPEIK